MATSCRLSIDGPVALSDTSEAKGSRVPPAYSKDSRCTALSTGGTAIAPDVAVAVVVALGAEAVVPRAFRMLSRTALMFTEFAASSCLAPPQPMTTRAASRLIIRGLGPTGRSLQAAGFHEGPDLELRLEQGAGGVTQRS